MDNGEDLHHALGAPTHAVGKHVEGAWDNEFSCSFYASGSSESRLFYQQRRGCEDAVVYAFGGIGIITCDIGYDIAKIRARLGRPSQAHLGVCVGDRPTFDAARSRVGYNLTHLQFDIFLVIPEVGIRFG